MLMSSKIFFIVVLIVNFGVYFYRILALIIFILNRSIYIDRIYTLAMTYVSSPKKS